MQSQRVLIVAGGAVVCLAVAFVVVRWRNPPPPPPAEAIVLVPGKAIGPFSIGMSRAAAEAKRTKPQVAGDPSLVVEGGVAARVRDEKVVGVSAELGVAGVALEGAWIPLGAHAKYTARGLAETMRNCKERRATAPMPGGAIRSAFDCGDTRIEVDETAERVTVVVGAF